MFIFYVSGIFGYTYKLLFIVYCTLCKVICLLFTVNCLIFPDTDTDTDTGSLVRALTTTLTVWHRQAHSMIRTVWHWQTDTDIMTLTVWHWQCSIDTDTDTDTSFFRLQFYTGREAKCVLSLFSVYFIRVDLIGWNKNKVGVSLWI